MTVLLFLPGRPTATPSHSRDLGCNVMLFTAPIAAAQLLFYSDSASTSSQFAQYEVHRHTHTHRNFSCTPYSQKTRVCHPQSLTVYTQQYITPLLTYGASDLGNAVLKSGKANVPEFKANGPGECNDVYDGSPSVLTGAADTWATDREV